MSGKDRHEAHHKKEHDEHQSKEKTHKASRDALQHEKAQHDHAVHHLHDGHKSDKNHRGKKTVDHAEERKAKRITESVDHKTHTRQKYDQHGRISGIEYGDGNSATIHYDGKHAEKVTVQIADKQHRTSVRVSTDSNHTVRVDQKSGVIEVLSINTHSTDDSAKTTTRYLPDGHVSVSHFDRKNQLKLYELRKSAEHEDVLERHVFEHRSLRETPSDNFNKTHSDTVITETVMDNNNKITDRFTYSSSENLRKQRATTHEHVAYSTSADGSVKTETHELYDLTKDGPATKISTSLIGTNTKTGEISHETLLANGDRQTVKLSKEGHPLAVTFTNAEQTQIRFSLKSGVATDVQSSHSTISEADRINLLNSANLSIVEAKAFAAASSEHPEYSKRSALTAFTDISDLTGTLVASGQRGEKFRVVCGKIFDSSKQLLGTLDENGLLHFAEASRGSAQPLTSVFNNHFEFQGEQNGLKRTIVCSDQYKLTDGKVFLPVNGKTTEFDVRLGMLIDSKTGEQLGSIAPPVVMGEQMSGGEITFRDGKHAPLASLAGTVFDLKVIDNAGRSMHESDIKGLSLGGQSDTNASGKSANDFLNIAATITREKSVVDNSEATVVDTQNNIENLSKAKAALTIASPLASFAINSLGLSDISKSAEDQMSAETMAKSFHEKQLASLDSLLKHGLRDPKQAEALGIRFQNTIDVESEKVAAPEVVAESEQSSSSDRPKITVPSITEVNVDTVQGKLRMGDQIYTIKNGTLYEKSSDNGRNTEVEAGKLQPNYKVSFNNGATVALADQYRVLLDVTIGEDSSRHQIVGLGPQRNTDSFGLNTGGLCDRKELYSQALDAQKAAASANADYFNKRSYATGWVANSSAGDFEGTMKQLEQRIEADTSHFKQQMDKLFEEGFDSRKINISKLDGHLDTAQLMLKNMGATASDTNDIAREGRQVQQLTNDSLVIAGTTVATAGIGAAPGLAAALAKGGTMVRVGVTAAEVASGSLAGGGISYVGRMSNSNDNVANFKAGLIEGGSMSASSAGFKLIGNSRMLGQARSIANDLRTEKTTMSALNAEQQALMTSGIGKLALAGKSDAYVRTVTTAHVIADSAMQSASFGTAAKIRDHNDKPLTMQELAIGTGAMLIGHYSRAGLASGVDKLGIKEHSVANAALSDMASAYGNGCAGQAVLAQQHERERVARLMKVSPDMVPAEALNYSNIFREVHDAGLISAMSAPFMTFGTRSIVALGKAASNPQLLMQRLSSASESTTVNSTEHSEMAHGFQAAKDLIGQHQDLTPELLTAYADQLRKQADVYAAQQQENVAAGYQHAANILAPDVRVFHGDYLVGEQQHKSLDHLIATANGENPVLKELQRLQPQKQEHNYTNEIPEPKDPDGVKFADDKRLLEETLTPETLLTSRFAQELTEKIGPLKVIVNPEGNWHRVFLYANDMDHPIGNAMITRKGTSGDDAQTFLVEHFLLQNPLKKTNGEGKEGLRADEFFQMQTAFIYAAMRMNGHAIESGGANNYRVSKLYKRNNFLPCNEQAAATYAQIERYRNFYNSKTIPPELKPPRGQDAETTGFESTLGSMTHLNSKVEDKLAWDQFRRAQETDLPEPSGARVIDYEAGDGTVVSAFSYTRKDGTTHLSFLKGTAADPLPKRELFEWSHEEVAGNLRLRQEFKDTND